jgi:hypothetical protein
VTLSPKQELLCWLVGGTAAVELFDYSGGASKLTATACYYGFALLSVVVVFFCLKFRKRSTPEPTWLKILSSFVLIVVTAVFLLYVAGIVVWYYE